MVGAIGFESMTSTVWICTDLVFQLTNARRLPKYTQVVQDIPFCGSDCGSKQLAPDQSRMRAKSDFKPKHYAYVANVARRQLVYPTLGQQL